MAKIKAIAQTIIRKQDIDSSLLDPTQKKNIPVGVSLGGDIFPARGQSQEIVLAGDLAGLGKKGDRWFLYAPHWEFPAAIPVIGKASNICPKGIRLDVPYFAQCDTRADGYRFCNSHANAMLTAFLLGDRYKVMAKGYSQPEAFYIENLLRYGDTTNSDAQTQCLKEVFSIESYWSVSLSPGDVYASLQAGFPVVCGFAYKGSGHICVIVGMQDGNYLIHDPYGVRNGTSNSYFCNSTDQGREGAYDVMSASAMDAIYWDQGGSDRESGWGRIITSVRGVQTGLKFGL
jgi:Papain-like cysteine protease AvrRpt2